MRPGRPVCTCPTHRTAVERAHEDEIGAGHWRNDIQNLRRAEARDAAEGSTSRRPQANPRAEVVVVGHLADVDRDVISGDRADRPHVEIALQDRAGVRPAVGQRSPSSPPLTMTGPGVCVIVSRYVPTPSNPLSKRARPEPLQQQPVDAELRREQDPARRGSVHGRQGRRPAAREPRRRVGHRHVQQVAQRLGAAVGRTRRTKPTTRSRVRSASSRPCPSSR